MMAARQTVIVTGAGSGIGAATAKLLASRGSHVVVSDLKQDAAELVCEDMLLEKFNAA